MTFDAMLFSKHLHFCSCCIVSIVYYLKVYFKYRDDNALANDLCDNSYCIYLSALYKVIVTNLHYWFGFAITLRVTE